MNIAAADAVGGQVGTLSDTGQASLDTLLHRLAQPMTVLCALLDDATLQCEAASEGMLSLARSECQRAVEAVRCLQEYAQHVGPTSGKG